MGTALVRSERAKFAEYKIGGNLGVYCVNSREKGGGLVSERQQPEEEKASRVRNSTRTSGGKFQHRDASCLV